MGCKPLLPLVSESILCTAQVHAQTRKGRRMGGTAYQHAKDPGSVAAQQVAPAPLKHLACSNQHLVRSRVEGPEVGGPVGVGEASAKGEEAPQELRGAPSGSRAKGHGNSEAVHHQSCGRVCTLGAVRCCRQRGRGQPRSQELQEGLAVVEDDAQLMRQSPAHLRRLPHAQEGPKHGATDGSHRRAHEPKPRQAPGGRRP